MPNYIALGDSITVGIGAPPNLGYADLLTHYLQSTYPIVYTKKIAHNGWTSSDLLNNITRKPALKSVFATSNLITLYIGGNDLNFAFIKAKLSRNIGILKAAINQFAIQYNELLSICRLHSRAIIITSNQYNPFPHSPLSCQFIQLINTAIVNIALRHQVRIVDAYTAFLGNEPTLISGYTTGSLRGFIPLIQKSPIHPNAQGHRLLADRFWQLTQA